MLIIIMLLVFKLSNVILRGVISIEMSSVVKNDADMVVCVLISIMLIVIILNVIVMNVILLQDILISVIMLSIIVLN